MDTAQTFILYVEWIFFAAWGMVLAAVSVIAFGKDILPGTQSTNAEKERSQALGR
jgi:hypothetical protein